MGTWNSSRHIEAISNKFKDDITGECESFSVNRDLL